MGSKRRVNKLIYALEFGNVARRASIVVMRENGSSVDAIVWRVGRLVPPEVEDASTAELCRYSFGVRENIDLAEERSFGDGKDKPYAIDRMCI
jgi:hypothetical protein